jgi:uncharacterized protein (TIGR03083 family)
MPDTSAWISATRRSHDRLTGLVTTLSSSQIKGRSYASEWTIADVLSHLGSQAEIFGAFLDAGFAGAPSPGQDVFQRIWGRWNALPPTEQIRQSIAANERLVSRFENLTAGEVAAFPLPMFGAEVSLTELLGMRLGEHAVHTWDVAAGLDRTATLSPDAVDLLVDTLGRLAARVGKPAETGGPIPVHTTDPERWFTVTVTPAVSITTESDQPADALRFPAEAFVRLVYGRLDAGHTPAGVVDGTPLHRLRSVFIGF